MKKKKQKQLKKYGIIIGIILLLSVVAYIGVTQTAYSHVDYDNQCSLPNCPYGYEPEDTYCSGLNCYQECKKTIPGHCSTNSISKSKTHTDYFNKASDFSTTVSLSLNPNKCYQYKAGAILSISDDDPCGMWYQNSESHKLKAVSYESSATKCSSSHSFETRASSYTDLKRGLGTISNNAYVYAYKKTGCGGEQSCGSDGKLIAFLDYKESDWIPESYDTKKVSCSFECNVDSQCGSKTPQGSPYCSGKEIKQDYNKPYCSSYSCEDKTTTETIKTCSYDCENGECIPKPGVDPYCGDGVCDSNENYNSCPSDCEAPNVDPYCGDDICQEDENYNSCPSDCEISPTGIACYFISDDKCDWKEFKTPSCPPNYFETKEECENNISDIPTQEEAIQDINKYIFYGIGILIILILLVLVIKKYAINKK